MHRRRNQGALGARAPLGKGVAPPTARAIMPIHTDYEIPSLMSFLVDLPLDSSREQPRNSELSSSIRLRTMSHLSHAAAILAPFQKPIK